MAAHLLAARALPQAVVTEPLAYRPDQCAGQTGAGAGPAVWLRASRPVLLILFTFAILLENVGLRVDCSRQGVLCPSLRRRRTRCGLLSDGFGRRPAGLLV